MTDVGLYANKKCEKFSKNKRESFTSNKSEKISNLQPQTNAINKLKRLKTGIDKVNKNFKYAQASVNKSLNDKIKSRQRIL